VSVFIDQPFAIRANVGNFQDISFWASAGALSSAFLTVGSRLSKSKLLPGSIPIRFIRAMIGSSVRCGGWSFMSSAA
jgi:hypothetical protein